MPLTGSLLAAGSAMMASSTLGHALLEAAGWMALAFVKFLVTPASAVAAGVDPEWAFAYSAGGATLGLAAMQPMAKAMFRWWSRRHRDPDDAGDGRDAEQSEAELDADQTPASSLSLIHI